MTKILNTLRVTGTGSNYQALGVTGGYLAANSAVIGVNGLPSSLLSIVGSSTASYFDISNGTNYLLQVYGTYSYFSNNVMIGNTTSHYGKSFQISTSNANAISLISSTDSYTYPISGGPTYGWVVTKHNEISFINTYYGRNDVVGGITLLSDGITTNSEQGINTSYNYGSADMVFSIGISSSNTLGITAFGQLNGEKMRITPDRGVQILNTSTGGLKFMPDQYNTGYWPSSGILYIVPRSGVSALLINSSQQNTNLTASDVTVNSSKYYAISAMNETGSKTNYYNTNFYADDKGYFGIRSLGTRGFISSLDRNYGNGSVTQSLGYAYRGGFNAPLSSLFTSPWTMIGFESSGGVVMGGSPFTSSFTADYSQVIDFRSRSWYYGETTTLGTYSWGKVYTRYGLLIDYDPTATYSYANPLGGTITDRRVGTAWGVWVGPNINNYFAGRTLYGATADDGTSLVQIAGTLSSQNILLTTNTPTTTSSLYSVVVRNNSNGRLETFTASLSSGTSSISGTGSTNYLALFNSSSTIAQSSVYQGATNKTIVIGYVSPSTYDTDTNALRVKGDVYFDNISNKFNIGGVQLFDNTNNNISLGNFANSGGTAGSNNVALGYSSLMSNQTGTYNVGVGFNALQTLTAGSYNMAVGANALYNNKGNRNTSIGYQSGYNSTGDGNTFIGNLSGTGMTSGNYNTFIGASSSWTSSIPSNYVVITDGIGTKKLVIDNTNSVKFYGPLIDIVGSTGLSGQVLSATSGGFVWATSSSSSSLSFIQGGNSFGALAKLGTNDNYALQFQTNATTKMIIGTAGDVNINTSSNPSYKLNVSGSVNFDSYLSSVVINGVQLFDDTGKNISLGASAGGNGLYGGSASYNIAVGHDSLRYNTNVIGKNIAIGYQSLMNGNGYDNIAIGYRAGMGLTSSGNIAIGDSAIGLVSTSNGVSNHGIGCYSLQNFNSGVYNHSYGDQSMRFLSSGSYNTSLGGFALRGGPLATGSYSNNTAVGYRSMGVGISTGSNNTALGYATLTNLSTGSNNTALGYATLTNLSTGSNNVVVGCSYSGSLLTSGNFNIMLGQGDGISTGSYNVLIGNYTTTTNTSNYVYLADGNSNLRMFIDDSGNTTFNGNVTTLVGSVNIGTSSNVAYDLNVNGYSYFYSNTSLYTPGTDDITVRIGKSILISESSLGSSSFINGLNVNTVNTYSGSISIPNSSGIHNTTINPSVKFSTSGTNVTVAQAGTGQRAISGLQIITDVTGTIFGTVSHLAGLMLAGLYGAGNTSNHTIGTYYQILINDSAEWGGVTFSNRYGIYQYGSSDKNYLNGNLLLGTTVDSGYQLQIGEGLTASWGTGNTSIQIDNKSIVMNFPGGDGQGVTTTTTGYYVVSQSSAVSSPVTIATISVAADAVSFYEITVYADSYNSGISPATSSHGYSLTKIVASLVRPYEYGVHIPQNISGFTTSNIYQMTYNAGATPSAFSNTQSGAFLVASTQSIVLKQNVTSGSNYSYRLRYEIKTTVEGPFG